MDFYDVLGQVLELLQRQKRISYRALKLQLKLDDDYVEGVKDELIYAQQVAKDEDNRVLVWIDDTDSAIESPSSPAMPESTLLPMTPPTYTPESYTPAYLAEKILTGKTSLEGERKVVTVLFADIKDSTELIRDLDPEDAQQLLDPAIHLMMDAVHRFEGTVNQVLGDGIMSIFGAPIAHEDHAARACYAALAMQAAMRDYTSAVRSAHGIEMQIRVGLNSGEVVVRTIGNDLHMDYSAVGATTHLAARMEQLARPGSIRLSSSTLRLVEGMVQVDALGTAPVKGMSEPVEVYELTGASAVRRRLQAAVARGLSKFVGRSVEIDALSQALEQAASRRGQIVAAVGEAGVGKSRLMYEFVHSHHTQGWRVLESASVSYGKARPYFPIIDLLKRYAHIEDGDDARTIRAKITGQILTLDESLHDTIPALLSLLDALPADSPWLTLDPPQRRQQTLDGLKSILLRESQAQPLVLVFEDLHWIDSETQALLDSLVENLPTSQLLLLVNYRPEYTHHWGSKTYYTQLRLDPLPPESADALLDALLGDDASLESLKRLLIERTEGNPFFLEESVRTLVETQVLDGEPGAYRLTQELPALQAPATVQAILAARMDRLPQDEKRLLQMAAVIGMEAPLRLLQALVEIPDETLYSHLDHLQAAEFLYETTLFPERLYTFKHALTQNVAYQSLLHSTRHQYHRRIVEFLENQSTGMVESQPELLAQHCMQGEIWDKAFNYLVKSGDKARLAYANQEAIAYYTQAIQVSEHVTPVLDPDQLAPVYEGRGRVWVLVTQFEKAIADFQMMLQMARASGNQRQEGESLIHLARVHNHTFSKAHLPFVEQYAQEARQLAQHLGNQHLYAQSLSTLGVVEHQWRGNPLKGDRDLEEALLIGRRVSDKEIISLSLAWLCASAYWRGDFPRAIQCGQEGADVSRAIPDGYRELLNLCRLCLGHWGFGNYRQALDVLYEGLTKARERESRFFISRLTNTLGWFHREFGDTSRAVELDHESMEEGRAARIPNVEVSALINLGFDYLALGQYERAQSYLEPTLERVEREALGSHRWRWTTKLFIGLAELFYQTGLDDQALRAVEAGIKEAQAMTAQKYIAQGWALRGKIIAKLGDAATAGAELQRAFTLAEQLRSPSLIYTIAYDLGQWHEATGQERDAAAMYGKAIAAVDQMVTAVEDEALRSTFLQSALAQEIHERATRLDG